jgi:hypothetical protein
MEAIGGNFPDRLRAVMSAIILITINGLKFRHLKALLVKRIIKVRGAV